MQCLYLLYLGLEDFIKGEKNRGTGVNYQK